MSVVLKATNAPLYLEEIVDINPSFKSDSIIITASLSKAKTFNTHQDAYGYLYKLDPWFVDFFEIEE